MERKKILIFSLIIIFSILFSAYSNAVERKFSSRHLLKKSAEKASQFFGLAKPGQSFGTQLTFTGFEKYDQSMSPDGNWIVFEDDEGIIVMPAQGGKMKNLTADIPGWCFNPRFNRRSTRVTFSRYDDLTDRYFVEIISLDGSGHNILAEDALHGRISPDGKYLVYRKSAEPGDLYIWDFGTTSEHWIAPGDGWYGLSCFTPDENFVITSTNDENGEWKLFKIPVQGGDPEQLTFIGGEHIGPEVSPDGKWILFTVEDFFTDANNSEEYFNTLFAYNMQTGETMPVFTDEKQLNLLGSFSPDGKRFSYLLDVDGVYEVFVTNFPFVGGPGEEPQAFINLISPYGGDLLKAGESVDITWESEGLESIRIEFSSDGGSNWTKIADNVPAQAGYYTWNVPQIFSYQCMINVGSFINNEMISAQTEGMFAIIDEEPVAGHLRVISPNIREEWEVGSIQTIKCESQGMETVTIMVT